MLGNIDAVANLAVKDLAVARRFYEDTLGLAQVDAEGDEVIVYRSGATRINVYRSQFAGTNQATAVTWQVGGDIGRIVSALKARACASSTTTCPTPRSKATSMSWAT
jgi:catechol 2,3-dioxygenase-like lactoylglutathione lyase family enzyme